MKTHFQFIVVSLLSLLPLFSNGQITAQPKLGYAISPVGHPNDFSQLGSFLTEVANTCDGGALLINGEWRNNLASSGIIPTLHSTFCQLQPSPFNYTEIPVFAWATYPVLHLDNSSDATNNWTNTSTRSAFLQMLIHTADSLTPTYIFIGNEVNFYYEQDSADYQNWSSFYSTAYDSIKAHSPATKVGTVFNYEHLAGRGQFVGWNTPYWNAFSSMDTSKMDVVGITLYPFLGTANATALPGNYLDALFNHIGSIPVVFTETGWTADTVAGALWNSSPTQQVDYVNSLFPMIAGRDVQVVNWLFLNYCMTTPDILFESVALRDSLGNDQPALPLWLSHCPSTTTAIDERSAPEADVMVYPNPSNGLVHFSRNAEQSHSVIAVYNALGSLVLKQEMLPNGLDYSFTFPKGIYLYQITTSVSSTTGKFIVN